MARPEQEGDEKEIIDYFISSRAIICSAALPENDPPDCVLQIQGKNVGVEIYEYHEPSEVDGKPSRRDAEYGWWRILEAIDDLVRAHYELETVRVCLDFKEFDVPPRHKGDEFVIAIIDFVKGKLLLVGDDFVDFPVTASDHPLLKKYLNFISIENVADYSWKDWIWTFGDATAFFSEGKTLRALHKKISRERPEGYDEYWLIVEQGIEIARGIYVFDVIQLETASALNAALNASVYDQVHIIRGHTGEYSWKRGEGWIALPPSKYPGRDIHIPFRRKRTHQK